MYFLFCTKGGERKTHTALSLHPNGAVQSVIRMEPERWGRGVSRRQGTYFHFNLVSAPRTFLSLTSIIIPWFLSVMTVTDAPHRREEHKSHSICLFYPWCPSSSCVCQGVFMRPRTEICWRNNWQLQENLAYRLSLLNRYSLLPITVTITML